MVWMLGMNAWYRLPQRATLKKYYEYRARGRPCKRWSDGIWNSLKKINNSLQNALKQAHARSLRFPPNTSVKK
uniref:Uncharacterized protein n=1 Tax=Arion vulgaris TaxID=1028688 RepID=A0A0B7BW83_9EUPU